MTHKMLSNCECKIKTVVYQNNLRICFSKSDTFSNMLALTLPNCATLKKLTKLFLSLSYSGAMNSDVSHRIA